MGPIIMSPSAYTCMKHGPCPQPVSNAGSQDSNSLAQNVAKIVLGAIEPQIKAEQVCLSTSVLAYLFCFFISALLCFCHC